jgi:RNA polymerase sigma-70 factor (ECF subfamily)
LNEDNNRLKPGEQTIYKYLVKRCKKGDRQAQNELYKLFANAMFNTTRRIMGDDEDAKDVLQESFIEAFAKIHMLKNEVTFPAWIKRIVVNKSINALRKKRISVTSLEEGQEVPFEEDEDKDKDKDIIKHEAARILRAIDLISEGCRTVFNLYMFEGYDHKEIGEVLSISESASKAQYSKAKSKIRKVLAEEYER